MTPSQEKQVMKDVKALVAANEALDAKQEVEIAGLKKKVKALAKRLDVLERPAVKPSLESPPDKLPKRPNK